jgi:site-specific recombinase XerD
VTQANFPALVQAFFTDHLLQQRRASPHTIAGYRDTFRLLLRFAEHHLGKHPVELEIHDLGAPFMGQFLHHLETERGNGVRTRNARLAAIRSFFKFVAVNEPCHALVCQRVLAMPNKRQQRTTVSYLDRTEVDALLAAPDLATWTGRRDRTLLMLAVQTGLRVSELIGLCCQNVVLGTGAHVRCEGKGRKQRCTPLRKDVVTLVEALLREQRGRPEDPVFPSLRGGPLSRDGVERLVAKHTAVACKSCPSLASKRVTPHVLRHTAAMDLLQHGVDHTVIALWLGHESPETTQIYLHADMSIKEKALARTEPVGVKTPRFRPEDRLLTFLEAL